MAVRKAENYTWEVYVRNFVNVNSRFLLGCSKVKLDELMGISHSHLKVLFHSVNALLFGVPLPLTVVARLIVSIPRFVLDGYYVAYKPITLSCILFRFTKLKFIHYHSCLMFVMKSMSIYND